MRSGVFLVLSACETGLGVDTRWKGAGGSDAAVFTHFPSGDEVVGIAAAFLAAGARGLVGSLWPVADDSTAVLMRAMYGSMREGRHPAAALRAAQLELLRSDSWRAPHFWAPFTYCGRFPDT